MQLSDEMREKLGELLRNDIAKAVAKLSLAATWPEIFGENPERKTVLAMSLEDMERRVEHHLLYSEGKSTPNGLLKGIKPS